MWATLRSLFPTQARGGDSSDWVGLTCSLKQERRKVATSVAPVLTLMWSPSSACRGRSWQEAVKDWGMFTLVGVPPSACRCRGWCLGREPMMEVPPLARHSTMVTVSQADLTSSRCIPVGGALHSHLLRLSLHNWALHSHPFRPSPYSQQQSFPWVHSPKPTL